MQPYIEARGIRELQAAYRKVDNEAKKGLQKELRRVARPAAERARGKARAMNLSRGTVGGIRPGSRLGMAVIRQSKRRTTGKRPKFGSLQMQRVLEPAAVETLPEAAARLEEMLDKIANGF